MTHDAPLSPFTQAWADAFRAKVNGNPEYRKAARRWPWPLALVLEPSPANGFPTPRALVLEFDGRGCIRADAETTDRVDAPFVITGAYGSWKRIMRGDLDPITAIVKRRLHLRGSLAKVLLHARAAKTLITCATTIPTQFPDDEVLP